MKNGWGTMRGAAFAAGALVALAGCPPPVCEDFCLDGSVPRADIAPRADVGRDIVSITDSPPPPCTLDGEYTYGYEGGRSVSSDQTALAPVAAYTRRRTFTDGTTAPIECSVPIPTCVAFGADAGDVLRVTDVVAAVEDPDVLNALERSGDDADALPVYGVDTRPMDGQVFAFRTPDGHGFYVGDPCDGTPGCRDVPDGLAVLEGLLAALDRQQLADPTCALLR